MNTEIALKYSDKYFQSFKDVFEKPYSELIEPITQIIIPFLENVLSEDSAVSYLQKITEDFEYTPFRWILHHINIDFKNQSIANILFSKNPNSIVYKHFEVHNYGFNLFSEIYEKQTKRLNHIETKAKLFRLSNLIENERANLNNSSNKPIISSTIFKSHKNCYAIFDYGILTKYNDGEIWDSDTKKYVPQSFQDKKPIRSFSFSVTVNNKKYKTIKNPDGSRTTMDENNNSETHYLNGIIETRLSNGTVLTEFPDGSVFKINNKGKEEKTDFDGSIIK